MVLSPHGPTQLFKFLHHNSHPSQQETVRDKDKQSPLLGSFQKAAGDIYAYIIPVRVSQMTTPSIREQWEMKLLLQLTMNPTTSQGRKWENGYWVEGEHLWAWTQNE